MAVDDMIGMRHYTVTCLDCMESTDGPYAERPQHCPLCGSSNAAIGRAE